MQEEDEPESSHGSSLIDTRVLMGFNLYTTVNSVSFYEQSTKSGLQYSPRMTTGRPTTPPIGISSENKRTSEHEAIYLVPARTLSGQFSSNVNIGQPPSRILILTRSK